jgi:hypothetical protein
LEGRANCIIPANRESGWCSRHDPAHALSRRAQAIAAARVGHGRLRPLSGDGWDKPDFTTSRARIEYRENIAAAKAAGEMDDKTAMVLAKLVDGAMQDDQRAGKPTPPPLIVEVMKYGPPNGDDAA